MKHEVRMPQLAQSVVEGEITRWLVAAGDVVEAEQPIAEIVTDKVDVELPSPVAGTVLEIVVPEGETVAIGTLIMVIDREGEETAAGSTPVYSSLSADLMAVEQRPAAAVAPAPDAPAATPARPGRPRAVPLARKLARELGVDLATVNATGPGGRITAGDVRRAAAGEPPAPAPGRVEYLPYSGRRKQIGERLVRAKQTIPHASCMEEIDVGALRALRAEHRPIAEQRGIRLTYLPYFASAAASTLAAHPIFNACLEEDQSRIALKKYYDFGIAVDTEAGLVVPVLRDAGRQNLLAVAADLQHLAERARQGRLEPGDVAGSTFTISNVGAEAVLFSVGVINAPEVALLNLHRMEQRPVVESGTVAARWRMYVTLTFDHRVADGGHAVGFLHDFKQRVEDVASWAKVSGP